MYLLLLWIIVKLRSTLIFGTIAYFWRMAAKSKPVLDFLCVRVVSVAVFSFIFSAFFSFTWVTRMLLHRNDFILLHFDQPIFANVRTKPSELTSNIRWEDLYIVNLLLTCPFGSNQTKRYLFFCFLCWKLFVGMFFNNISFEKKNK